MRAAMPEVLPMSSTYSLVRTESFFFSSMVSVRIANRNTGRTNDANSSSPFDRAHSFGLALTTLEVGGATIVGGGGESAPYVVDWNNDGKRDLVVGNQSGKVLLFLNIGNDNAPSFTSNGANTYISVDSYATPVVTDWNNDGKFDVICGSGDGKIYIFINEGDNKNPTFGKAQTLKVNNKELKLPTPTSVITTDWDDDGKADLLVSNKEVVEEGVTPDRKNIIPLGIYLLFNTGTKEKPEFKEMKQIKGKFKDDSAL